MNRRQLLALAGTAMTAGAAGACAEQSAMSSPATPDSTTPSPIASAPPPPEAAPAVAASSPMLCRDAWGAQPPRPGGVPHTISRMTIHHTAVVLGDNRNAPARLRQHQLLHQNDQGWIDIAYHVGVDRNGNIYELRDPLLVGDTNTEYDPTGHFLVLCEGNFDEEPISAEQIHSAAMAFAWAAQNFTVAPDTLAGHRDFASTACPGANLYAEVASGELRRRVDDLLAAGPVDLHKICGPEAAERVAAIEAGQ